MNQQVRDRERGRRTRRPCLRIDPPRRQALV